MGDIDEVEVEQFSDASRERLSEAALSLIGAVERHMVALVELSGGSGALETVLELNRTVEHAAAAWDGAVFDHTGVFPLALEVGEPDGEEDEDEVESESEPDQAISVVARWDQDVVNVAQLVDAGRQALRRLDPTESNDDAAVAIGDDNVAHAVYALAHEFGEPWFDMPGVEVVGGLRAYLHRDPDEPVVGADEDDDTFVPVIPNGEVLFSEGW